MSRGMPQSPPDQRRRHSLILDPIKKMGRRLSSLEDKLTVRFWQRKPSQEEELVDTPPAQRLQQSTMVQRERHLRSEVLHQEGPFTAGFSGFRAARFRFPGPPPQPLRQWLLHLPSQDPKHRFSPQHLHALLALLDLKVAKMRGEGWYAPEAVLQRVVEANRKSGHELPPKLRDDILAVPLQPLGDDHTLALLLYSVELYGDDGKPAAHQLYRELNRICREYAHAADSTPDLVADWELFSPMAAHVNAAIAALPAVPMVVYRGASHVTDTAQYGGGTRGAWGGFLSASSDRRQAVSFLSHHKGLQGTGSYFIIMTDQARPIYQLSEFPEEMEYLHPLDLELEVCCILPIFFLTKASVNAIVVLMKRAGAKLSLDIYLSMIMSLTFILDDFYSKYIIPSGKTRPDDLPAPVEDLVQKFLTSDDHTLLISGAPGVGKTSCAMWLTLKGAHEGWIFVYVCVGRVPDPLAPGALAGAAASMYGLSPENLVELFVRQVVIIIDNIHLDPRGHPNLHEANGLPKSNVKIAVVCCAHQLPAYREWCGAGTAELLLQPLAEEAIDDFVAARLAGPAPPASQVAPSRPDPAAPEPVGSPGGVRFRRVRTFGAGGSDAASALLRQLRASPLWAEYCSPAALTMATDLHRSAPQALSEVQTLVELHLRWFDWYVATKASEDVASDRLKAEALAWEVQVSGCTMIGVGPRGREPWFRRLPLLLADYNPTSWFAFLFYSLKEALVAHHIWRHLTAPTLNLDFLAAAPLKGECNIRKFVVQLYCAAERSPGAQEAYKRLGRMRTAATGPAADNAAAFLECIERARDDLRDVGGSPFLVSLTNKHKDTKKHLPAGARF